MEKNNTIAKYADWLIKRRWLVIIGSVALAVMIASGARFLAFNNDYHVFFGEDNPQLMAYDALHDKYTQDDNVFIVIQPEDGKVFKSKTLEAIAELTEQSWQTPYSSRVDAITNFQYTHSVQDDLYVEDLVQDPATKTVAELEKIKQIALDEPAAAQQVD